jgi:hypothetical protein
MRPLTGEPTGMAGSGGECTVVYGANLIRRPNQTWRKQVKSKINSSLEGLPECGGGGADAH